MVAESQPTQKQLYDTDYNLWVLETVKQLENRDLTLNRSSRNCLTLERI